MVGGRGLVSSLKKMTNVYTTTAAVQRVQCMLSRTWLKGTRRSDCTKCINTKGSIVSAWYVDGKVGGAGKRAQSVQNPAEASLSRV